MAIENVVQHKQQYKQVMMVITVITLSTSSTSHQHGVDCLCGASLVFFFFFKSNQTTNKNKKQTTTTDKQQFPIFLLYSGHTMCMTGMLMELLFQFHPAFRD